jgi:hypothetical protein
VVVADGQEYSAKLKKSLGVKDCDDLMNLMDQHGAKQDADDSSLLDWWKRSKGDPKEDLRYDEENVNRVPLVKFLYSKQAQKSKALMRKT